MCEECVSRRVCSILSGQLHHQTHNVSCIIAAECRSSPKIMKDVTPLRYPVTWCSESYFCKTWPHKRAAIHARTTAIGWLRNASPTRAHVWLRGGVPGPYTFGTLPVTMTTRAQLVQRPAGMGSGKVAMGIRAQRRLQARDEGNAGAMDEKLAGSNRGPTARNIPHDDVHSGTDLTKAPCSAPTPQVLAAQPPKPPSSSCSQQCRLQRLLRHRGGTAPGPLPPQHKCLSRHVTPC
jgi:hypothetical protein